MKAHTLQTLGQVVKNIKYNVDCLMIRMASCEQLLDRLITNNNNSNRKAEANNKNNNSNKDNNKNKTKQDKHQYCSLDQIDNNNSSSEHNKQTQFQNRSLGDTQLNNKNIPAQIDSDQNENQDQDQEYNRKQFLSVHEEGIQISSVKDNSNKNNSKKSRNKKSQKVSSITNLLILPTAGSHKKKQQRQQQVQHGSLPILKNAILVNMHQIEALEQDYSNMKAEYHNKMNKNQQAIALMANLITLLQDKIQSVANTITNFTFNSKTKARSKSGRNVTEVRSPSRAQQIGLYLNLNRPTTTTHRHSHMKHSAL